MILDIKQYSSVYPKDDIKILICKGMNITAVIEDGISNDQTVSIYHSGEMVVSFFATRSSAVKCLEEIEKALLYDKASNPEMFI